MNWPNLRAILVCLHILAVGLIALPSPSGAQRKSAWADQTVQDELAAWSERLQIVGLDWTPDQLQDHLWRFTKSALSGRDKVLAPFRPYYKYFGTHQGWRMFVAPHRYPSRLTVEVEEQGEWVLVYQQLSATHTWKQPQIEHARGRSALFRYSWRSYKKAYSSYCAWIAHLAAADFPEATRVRVQWHKARSPSPEEVLEGNIPAAKAHSRRVLDLSELR